MVRVNTENLEMEELVQRYKKRDLAQTYFFKMACRVFGPPKSRDRVMIAPPMHVVNNAQRSPVVGQQRLTTSSSGDAGLMSVTSAPPVRRFTTFPEEKSTADQDWVKDRKAFRQTLNGMGNMSQWINNKPLVTELELTVAERERIRQRESHQVRSELRLSPEPKRLSPICLKPPALHVRAQQAPDVVEKVRRFSQGEEQDRIQTYQQRRKGGMREEEMQALMQTMRSGSPAQDAHSSPSSLDGASGRIIDHYRRQELGQYLHSLELCTQYGVNIAQSSMQRVLLHPGDKGVQVSVGGGIRQAGASPLPGCGGRLRGGLVRTTGPASREEEEEEVEEEEPRRKVRKEKSLYPPHRAVRKEPKLMSLSTGRAEIHHKTECWLTREEYAQLRGQKTSTRRADPNAFWPGQDDHIRLYQSQVGIPPESCLFEHVTREPAPSVGAWPVNDRGYSTSGDIEGHKAYTL
ncbi:hypothetical protein ACEWY4_013280 [Coilia grayii]|uniref:Uncharacterized protein n=1 Tax=Coilia grayii TaxID=363190 RepID=A0ABD1JVW7_9TELE